MRHKQRLVPDSFMEWIPVWENPLRGALEMKLGSRATFRFARKISRGTVASLSRRGLKCGSTGVKLAEVVTAFQL